MTKVSIRFKMFQGKDKQWYMHIIARNGRILMTSEGYKRKAGARHCRNVILRGLSVG